MFRRLVSSAVLGSAMLLTSVPALANPPPWAPAHGVRAKQQYVYYPRQEIYYAPARDVWYWLDGGSWRYGGALPVYYRQYTTGGVAIELDADRPYDRHVQVVERYGRPRYGSYRYASRDHDDDHDRDDDGPDRDRSRGDNDDDDHDKGQKHKDDKGKDHKRDKD